MSQYVINALACQDLNEIANYFAENSVEAGERFCQAFNRQCQQLVTFPTAAKATNLSALDCGGSLLRNALFFTESSKMGLKVSELSVVGEIFQPCLQNLINLCAEVLQMAIAPPQWYGKRDRC